MIILSIRFLLISDPLLATSTVCPASSAQHHQNDGLHPHSAMSQRKEHSKILLFEMMTKRVGLLPDSILESFAQMHCQFHTRKPHLNWECLPLTLELQIANIRRGRNRSARHRAVNRNIVRMTVEKHPIQKMYLNRFSIQLDSSHRGRRL